MTIAAALLLMKDKPTFLIVREVKKVNSLKELYILLESSSVIPFSELRHSILAEDNANHCQ